MVEQKKNPLITFYCLEGHDARKMEKNFRFVNEKKESFIENTHEDEIYLRKFIIVCELAHSSEISKKLVNVVYV